ncbi:NB-ARC domain-containing protein [Clostridioides sp. ES-S-0001-03]|uniref:NACHT domain-containing protein n=1 Tax=Clostridioides sp. ES-S-0001-03 TaxID=2770771 RepID=UPI001D0C599B
MEAELCAQAIIAASKVVKSTGADEMIKDLVKKFLSNKVEEALGKQRSKKELKLIENKFNEYMERSYKNYIYMNTIVFRNQQKTIDDLYIPLTVSKRNVFDSSYEEEEIYILINSYKDDFLPKYKRVLLIDQAGMGKSTIAKYLYLSSINESKGIPILIELRRLSQEKDIIDFIMNEINGISEHFDKEGVLKLIERGDFIFFLDGYDEINKEYKTQVTEKLQNFVDKAGNNTFLMTSREEDELLSFGNFQSFYIYPLKKEEAYNLIKKYNDDNEEISRLLMKKIEEDKNFEIIKEFLENPLMVSLLCESFKYKQSIPHKKDAFYRQVYDALFEKHDYSKRAGYYREKKSGLNLEEFHKILRTIGFITLTKGVSYSKEELINIIYNSKRKNIGLEFNENDLLYDLIHNVPVFVKDGIEYRWSHKSFQEYFAASYICYDSDEKSTLLKKMSEGNRINKYYNVLDFCYDIDYKSFMRSIILPTIKDLDKFFYEKYHNDTYNDFNENELSLRKAMLFNYKKIYMYLLSEDEITYFSNKEVAKSERNSYIRTKIPRKEEECYKGIVFDGVFSVMGLKKDNITNLLRLLKRKESNLVCLARYNSFFANELINRIESGLYCFEDDIDNELNKKKNFNLGNDILSKYLASLFTEVGNIIFDYKECIRVKKEIEKEMEEEKNDIDFL